MMQMLPESVLHDIFSRLPVKSIVRCKCVCKEWRGIVSDPCFINLHISKSHQCLLIHQWSLKQRPSTLKCIEIEDDYHFDPVKTLELTRCDALARYRIHQVCSVNGLIWCWSVGGSVCILNPLLDECMALPPPQEGLTLGYGFGISTAGEYKVIRISYGEISSDLDAFYRVKIEVYTLGTDHWRCLGLAPFSLHTIERLSPGLYLNSHVYWQLGNDQIYDFDLITEKFKLFPSPPADGVKRRMLGVVKGSISCIDLSSEGLEMWLMKEESWCKMIAIEDDMKPNFLDEGMWRPTCVVNGSEDTRILLLEDYSTHELVVYCLDTNIILTLDLDGFYTKIIAYRPTFLSLHNFGSDRVHAI